jgi:hypothetical protein
VRARVRRDSASWSPVNLLANEEAWRIAASVIAGAIAQGADLNGTALKLSKINPLDATRKDYLFTRRTQHRFSFAERRLRRRASRWTRNRA